MAISRRAFTTAVGALALTPVSAETVPPFQVDDVVVSDPRSKIQDIEFDIPGNRFVWQDKDGNIWVGNVSPYTGAVVPRDAKAELVDTLAAGIAATGNGPEWVFGSQGTELLYTKFTNESRSQFQLARARKVNGVWVPQIIPNATNGNAGLNGNAPIGSLTPGDPNPLIKYFIGPPSDKRRYLAWMEMYNPSVGGIIPESTAIAGRWVVGERTLILTVTVDNTRQVVLYDVDTGILTQLTFDPGDKNNPFMWHAPDFNNELIFCATTSGTFIGIYRKINGVWIRIKEIKPPSPRPFLLSPEPFIFNNRSYMFMLTAVENTTGASSAADVWIAGLDPNLDFYRQVSDSQDITRMDPEVYIAQQGAFIYYNEPQGRFHVLHRCATGLGPKLT